MSQRLLCLVALAGITVCTSVSSDRVRSASAPSVGRATLPRSFTDLPLSFEPNQGQTSQEVRFVSHESGYTLFLTDDEAVFATSSHGGPPSVLRMKFVESGADVQAAALDRIPGSSNYFIGADARRWRTRVPHYTRVLYRNIVPGVDLVFYGNERRLEFDCVVSPGADPARIRFRLSGEARAGVDAGGDLLVRVGEAEFRFHKPVVYQEAADGRTRNFIDARYVLTSEDEVGFRVAAYDRARSLVIDPALSYGTWLGGSGFDSGNGIATDAAGNAYITGETASTDFPLAAAYQGAITGASNVFVTKLDPSGTSLVYSTYLGGSLADRGNGIAVDSSGSASVTGRTNSPDFPLMRAWQSQLLGDYDAFVTKLSPDGSALLFSTYLGGSGNDEGAAIAVDSFGMIYVTGGAGVLSQDDFPTTAGAFQRLYGGGMNDAFVSKFDPTQSGPAALVYSTLLGGGDRERGNGIAVDSAGNAYVTGRTGSSTATDFPFPLKNALQPLYGGGAYDAFVTELNANGTDLVYSTYLGDTGSDQGYGIAIDPAGNAYVAGVTASGNFPTTNAYQASIAGATDAFAAVIATGGGARLYSTYFGGSGADLASGIAVDGSGVISITGRTASPSDFPTTADAVQPSFGGGANDAFVAKFNPAQTGPASLVYSSFLGGGGDENMPSPGPAGNPSGAVAVDPSGKTYVTGNTSSPDFPTINPYQATYHGAVDAFVAVLSSAGASFTVSGTPAASTIAAAGTATYTVTVTPAGGFTGTVALTVSGLPPDASAMFDPASVVVTDTTPQVSTLVVNTAVSTPAGTFPLAIAGASGSLSAASTVNLTVAAGTATLSVTIGTWPNPVAIGTNLTYEIRVTNLGPVMATGVQVSDMLPATLVSAASTQGTCGGADTVTCDLGPLDVGSRATVTIAVSPQTTGPISNTANAVADQAPNTSATAVVSVVPSGAGGQPVDVLQHHLHATRDGLYIDPLFTRSAATAIHRDLSFSVTVPGPVYAQPLYVTNGPGGAPAYVVATEQNAVLAIDASDGSQLWQRILGTPVPRSALNCGDIDPLGITGTPVIDAAARLIFLDAMTTPDAGVTKQHLIYALSLDDGSVVPGWPVDVGTLSYNDVKFDSAVQNQRGALLLNAGVLYVPYGGHFGDCTDFDGTPYHGWVVAIPESAPTSAVAWATDGNQAGIWGVGGLSTDGNSVFAATGNTSTPGVPDWSGGEAVIRLGLDDTFSHASPDFFTPSNWRLLDQFDLDLGGEAPLLVDLPGATPSQLVVALGKSGVAHLLDRNNLGGIGTGDGENAEGLFSVRVAIDNPPGAPTRGRIRTAAATYATASGTYVVFSTGTPGTLGVGCPGDPGDLVAFRINPSSPPTISVAWCANDNGPGRPFAGRGAPIVTTTDGSSQPIVWTIGAEGTNRLYAYDGETGMPLFSGGGPDEQMTQVRRFVTPMAVNGRIVVASDDTLYVFTTTP